MQIKPREIDDFIRFNKRQSVDFFLNFVSPLLKHQDYESYNIFVDIPFNANRKVNAMINSHSATTWNDKVEAPLRRSDYKGFISMLDSNFRVNIIIFVLERLDKVELFK